MYRTRYTLDLDGIVDDIKANKIHRDVQTARVRGCSRIDSHVTIFLNASNREKEEGLKKRG